MKAFFSNKYTIAVLFTICGILLGRLFFHSHSTEHDAHEHQATETEHQIWTCSMHPNIRMDAPGKCPICGMDLIILTQNSSPINDAAVHLSKEAIALAEIETSKVERHRASKQIRLYGKIQADERLLQSQVAHISGRIERLLVNYTGETVRKGQTLALIYSPQLVTAQQELLEARKSASQMPELYTAAWEKLLQLKLTPQQIETIESSGKVISNIELVANTSGIVTSLRVNQGDYINTGAVLYDIADLSAVWALFEVYESDLSFIAVGNKLAFTVQALPGTKFAGKISFIDPSIDPVTRTAKVRVEVTNSGAKLKPEMFATATVDAQLGEYADNIVIPRSAVLWTGKRSIVYVRKTVEGDELFELREVELGPTLGNSYVIISGLADGEQIVTHGAFSIDAAAQLEGKPSMMNHSESEEAAGKHDAPLNEQDQKVKKEQASFAVQGLCDMCRERIEEAAKSVNGVTEAIWDPDTKELMVTFKSGSLELIDIHRAVAAAGHDTKLVKAKDEIYNELPGCCQYR